MGSLGDSKQFTISNVHNAIPNKDTEIIRDRIGNLHSGHKSSLAAHNDRSL